jgi:hypothetical protein
MSRFLYPNAVFPSRAVSHGVQRHGLIAAGIIIVMVVAQLMTLEKFSPMMERIHLFNETTVDALVAYTSVITGVFSLPFLMRIATSPLFRLMSSLCVIFFCSIWIMIGVAIPMQFSQSVPGSPILGSLSTSLDANTTLVVAVLISFIIGSAWWRLKGDISLWK